MKIKIKDVEFELSLKEVKEIIINLEKEISDEERDWDIDPFSHLWVLL